MYLLIWFCRCHCDAMASAFRRKVSYQVMAALKQYVSGREWSEMYYLLPLCLKLSKSSKNSAQYSLSWKEVINLKPELQNHLQPETVLTYLRNQDFPVSGCIGNISLHEDRAPTYVFDIDNKVFAEGVMSEVCTYLENLPDRSSFFRNVPEINVIVEYSSPNIAKPFHYGHFRSTVLGNFIGNINQFVGHTVTRLNFLGDWGLQYGILAAGYQEFGSEEKLKEDPLNHLYEVYKKANSKNEEDPAFNTRAKQHFRKMEEGDKEALLEWEKLRDLSIAAMNKTYERLGIRFDEVHGESMYAGKVKAVLDELAERKVIQSQNDGLLTVITNKGDTREEEVVLQKSDGASVYLSRDIAAAVDRKDKYNFDAMYYVVDSSQSKHFRNLVEILKCMGYYWASDVHHVPFGRIVKFSTRKGSAVFLDDILNEAQERTLESMKTSPNTKVQENMESVADILGISSLIINDMSVTRRRNYEFDWDRVLNMTGNSGVSLQYCHARITGIKENCGIDLDMHANLSHLTEPEAFDMILHLAKFDEAVYRSYISLEPYVLVHYLFRLKSLVGSANKVLTVKDQNVYVAQARLLLFHAAQKVLSKGLEILGITPLDHM